MLIQKTLCSSKWGAVVFLCSLTFLCTFKYVYAVPGQLNYDFTLPQKTIPIKDTKELDACKKKSEEKDVSLKNCQQTNTIFQDAIKKAQEKQKIVPIYILLSGISGFILGLIVSVLLWRKKT